MESKDKTEFSHSFAERIKALRIQKFGEKRGASSAASVALGVSPAEWRGYEMGVLPGAERLHQICKIFSCDANWLLGLQPEGQPLSQSQKEFVNLLVDTQSVLHGLDNLYTDFLSNLSEALNSPSQAQEHCHQLHRISRMLGGLQGEISESEKGRSKKAPQDG